MDGELEPLTEPGKRFVALAEEHAEDFAKRADEHDLAGSFPHENIKALQQSGFMAAPVPGELGGMGVESSHDFATGMSRLARGDASTAIASNMHIVAARVMASLWRNRETADPAMTGPVEAFMKAIAAGQLVACVPGTERGTDVSSPMAEVTPAEGGYVLNGRKVFATMSPAANIMFSTARLRRDDGTSATALCVIPKGTPGMEVIENWDALGMRASGSGEIVYTDCKLPAASVVPQGEWGVLGGSGVLEVSGFGNSLPACFLGIAESAQKIAIEMLAKRKGASGKRMADRVPLQMLLGENEIDLFAARAAVERVARLADETTVAADGTNPRLQRESQSMKWTVEHAAIRVVNNAMTISGGAGFMTDHPLSRLYRDVRAGPFMQPFGEYEIKEFLGKSTLGITPALDR